MKHFHIKEIGDVTIRKNRRSKRLRASAKMTGEILVTIPYHVSYRDALDFLISHKEKVLEIKGKIHHRKTQYERYETGKTYKTKRQSFSLDNHCEGKFKLELMDKNQYKLYIPKDLKTETDEVQFYIREFVRKLYKDEAKTYLVPRVRFFAQKHGFNINRVFIKNAKTRWGSCSSKNNINLNLNLMRLPEKLIDYVILHELSHLKHPNHSIEFWRYLGTLIENPKKYDKELKQYSLHQFAT